MTDKLVYIMCDYIELIHRRKRVFSYKKGLCTELTTLSTGIMAYS